MEKEAEEEIKIMEKEKEEERKSRGETEKSSEKSDMKDGYLIWKIPWSLSVNYSIN